MFSKNVFYFKLTQNEQLNILFRRLLTINPNQRMAFPELKKYIFSDNFLKEKIKFINNDGKYEAVYNDINKNIEKYNSIEKDEDYSKESTLSNLTREQQMNNVIRDTDLDDIQDIMNYYYGDIENENINNIIYYDENVNNNTFKLSIYGECDIFERETNGAFIFCTNTTSLNYIMREIKLAKEKDNRVKFNLIVTGQSCDKVVISLFENNYYDLIEKICIFCFNRQAHIQKMEFYPKIVDVFVDPQNVIDEFIKKFASKEIKPFIITKLLTFKDYEDKYHIRHEKLSKYYGELDEKLYEEAINNLIEYIKKDKNLKIEQKDLINSFKKFGKNNNCFGDIQSFNKLIKEYTKDTFYADLNKWLLSLNKNSYEYTAYFTGRFMYCLNSFASERNKYYKMNEIIQRGLKLPYSCLQLYERAIGKIIILSSFTSSTLDKKLAIEWSGRDTIKEEYEKKLLFSVIFYIENVCKENWIMNGVDIHEESEYPDEKEILFLPFSFYYLKDVKLNLEEKIADIYLRTCGKKEIIEEKLKEGKEIIIKEENNDDMIIEMNKKNDIAI